MRSTTALLCFSLILSAASAAVPAPLSPTDTYISARNRYIADFATHPTRDAADKRMDRALADLESQLTKIIPAWRVPGFPALGKINLGSLERDIDFGRLDGLEYRAGDTDIVVTTPALLHHWMVDHDKWWEGSDNIGQPFEAGIRTEAFWTYALFGDAHAYFYGEVPVTRPNGINAAEARIFFFTNGEANGADPDTLAVFVMQQGRSFVAQQKLKPATHAIAGCQTALKQTTAKSEAAYQAYRASGLKDTQRFDESVKLEAQADHDYRACFAQHLREQPNYAAIQKQAQALVDLLH